MFPEHLSLWANIQVYETGVFYSKSASLPNWGYEASLLSTPITLLS